METTCTFRVSGCERSVEAYVENGLYIAESKSGNGKTYLCKSLKKYAAHGEKVLGYTYDDYMYMVSISKELEKKPKLVMIDRYDMYANTIDDALIKTSKDAIVVVCLNQEYIEGDIGHCELKLTKDAIEINPIGTAAAEWAETLPMGEDGKRIIPTF